MDGFSRGPVFEVALFHNILRGITV